MDYVTNSGLSSYFFSLCLLHTNLYIQIIYIQIFLHTNIFLQPILERESSKRFEKNWLCLLWCECVESPASRWRLKTASGQTFCPHCGVYTGLVGEWCRTCLFVLLLYICSNGATYNLLIWQNHWATRPKIFSSLLFQSSCALFSHNGSIFGWFWVFPDLSCNIHLVKRLQYRL